MDEPIRILLIDEDRDDREASVRSLLRELGSAEVEEIGSAEALEQALRGGFQLVITEHKLSWTDSRGILERIRNTVPLAVVIVQTRFGNEQICAEAMRLGAADYVVKQHRGENPLPAAVRDALARASSQRQLRQSEAEALLRQRELERANQVLERRVAERTAEAEQRTHQLRLLAAELTRTEQRERRRLSQLLHDHLQQLLAAAKLHLRISCNRLPHVLPNPDRTLDEALAVIGDLIDQSIDFSRNLTVQLSPPVLHDGGLRPAMTWLARHLLREHALSVTVDTEGDTDPVAEEVRELLFQAAREFLFNVVKHAHVDHARLRLRRLDDALELCVEDDGRGVDLKRPMPDGTENHFGLFSIRERAELLGGAFEFESVPGRGTSVRLTVPMTTSEPPTGTVNSRANRRINTALQRRPSMHGSQNANRPPVRVLLADDHRLLRASLAAMLRAQEGIEIVGQAGNGQEAVDLATQLSPDVVLMDISMPVMDGIEATRQIVRALPTTKVIGLSMHERGEMQEAMRTAGAIDYFTKGGPPDPLIAAIFRVGVA
jgi:signal transduction histidine kinase